MLKTTQKRLVVLVTQISVIPRDLHSQDFHKKETSVFKDTQFGSIEVLVYKFIATFRKPLY